MPNPEFTNAQKEIIKGYHGEYMGQLTDYIARGGYRPAYFNSYDPTGFNNGKYHGHSNLMQTEKTERACRNCKGNGWTFIIHQNLGKLVTKHRCTGCMGTGRVFG